MVIIAKGLYLTLWFSYTRWAKSSGPGKYLENKHLKKKCCI